MRYFLLIFAVVALVGCETTIPPTKNDLIGTWSAPPRAGFTQPLNLTLNENNTFTLAVDDRDQDPIEKILAEQLDWEPEAPRHGRWKIEAWEIRLNYKKTDLVEWLKVTTDYRALKLMYDNRKSAGPSKKTAGLDAVLLGAILGGAIGNNVGGGGTIHGAVTGAAIGGGPSPSPPSGKSRVPNGAIYTPTYSQGLPIVEKVIRQAIFKPIGKLTESDLEKVTRMDLYNNQLASVKGLEKLTQLTMLFLGRNQLTDIKGLEKLTKLTWLSLQDNPDLTKAQIDELKKALPNCYIESNPPLTKEESAKVVEAAIRKAAGKPTGELTKADYEQMQKLRLSRNQLTDVKGLEKLSQLSELSLNNNNLSNVKGLENLTQLTRLRLDHNQLTEVPKELEKLNQLTWLNLQNNPDLTKAQIAELKKALPKCIIISNPKK